MTDTCPLCSSVSTLAMECIPVRNVVRWYKRILGIDIYDAFRGLTFIYYKRCSYCNLGYFSPPVTGSEQFYEELQQFGWYYQDDKHEFDFAKNFIRSTDDVLEIGCGKGAFAKLIDARRYVGLEFSKKARGLATANGVMVYGETVQAHSLNNVQAYDVVCSFQVLEHVVGIHSFIDAAVACLKSGGCLIISTPSVDSCAAFVSNSILDMPPHHVTRWSDVAYRKLADIFNLELVELWHEPLQPIHRKFYAQAILVNAVMGAFNRKRLVWDDSFLHKCVSLICQLPSNLLARCFSDLSLSPRGMSVVAVFIKK